MNLDWNSTVEMVDFRVASTVSVDIVITKYLCQTNEYDRNSRMGTDLVIMLISNMAPLYSGSYF